ncbi:MAG: hypothetical protein ACON5A_03720 [Candidatus Comchoanobacterales bacterium]
MRLKSQLLAIVAASTMVINIHASEEQENIATGEDTVRDEIVISKGKEELNASEAKTDSHVEDQATVSVYDDESTSMIIESKGFLSLEYLRNQMKTVKQKMFGDSQGDSPNHESQ